MNLDFFIDISREGCPPSANESAGFSTSGRAVQRHPWWPQRAEAYSANIFGTGSDGPNSGKIDY